MDNNSFFSIDRLVEFGLGMAMARQMVNVMNESMQNMYVPGSIQSMPASQHRLLYVAIDGQSVGPLTESEFSRLVTEKKITKASLAWIPGMSNWQPIEQIPEILRIIAFAPPPIPVNM